MASGGNSTNLINRDIVHIFTGNGNFVCDFYGTVELLMVAGGGGGGNYLSGGGGGGGVIYRRAFQVTPQTYSIVIGGGGGANSNGGNTTFGGLTAIGGGSGGGGGAWNAGVNGGNGGSGGGASGEYYVVKTGGTATSGQGQAGGNSRTYANGAYAGGGGGGYAGVGVASIATSAGNGGAGFACSISGSLQYYGAGGGGNAYRESGSVTKGYGGSGVGGNGAVDGIASEAPTSGVDGTGSGGGGGTGRFGYGGSGIVIIRYNQDSIIIPENTQELATLPFYKDPDLVSYWRMNNSTDEKGAVTATDYNMSYGTGIFGNCAVFNGSSSRIDLSNSTGFDTQRLTISAWVYATTFDQNGFIFEKGSVNTQYSLFFESNYLNFRTPTPGFVDYTDISTIARNADTGIVNGQWNHICATYDGKYKRLYVNGVLCHSKKFLNGLTTGNSGERIGAYGGASPGYWFNGKIDDLAVFKRALSPEEVKLIFTYPPAMVKYGRDRITGSVGGL